MCVADNLTPEQRSYCMSKVKGRDTSLERIVRSHLHRRGLRFRKHVRDIPGNPDIVFPRQRIAVFIDGDFWHGYQFPKWKHKLSDFWQKKIEENRRRDQRNFARFRQMGWIVIRVWEHEIKSDLEMVVDRIEKCVRERST